MQSSHLSRSIQAFFNLVRFYDRFRLSVSEFCYIYRDLLPLLNKPIKDDAKHARLTSRVLTPAEMLVVFLYRSDNADKELLSIICHDISPDTIERYNDLVTKRMIECYGHLTQWPDAEERQASYGHFSSYEQGIGIIDGTHCQIRVPIYGEYEHYSGYKGYHTQNYLIICDFMGLIIFHSDAFCGRDNDRAAFNQSTFVTTVCPLLSAGEKLLSDGGFQGPGHIFHQHTAQELLDASPAERPDMVMWNQEFDLNRTLIEHTIHRLKNRAQGLATRFPRSMDKQSHLFSAAACLCNKLRLLRMQQQMDTLNMD